MEETERERGKRRRHRSLFDAIAADYDACRLGYPLKVVESVIGTAGLGAGGEILEVGCGTGQLTESLAGRGFRLTAIDIGPALIAAARRRVDDADVSFEVTSFEEFAAADNSFDLVASGAAYHWIDPEIRYSKPARLLRPGGWLALLGYDERYDDPFGAALLRMWTARSDLSAPWAGPQEPGDAAAIAASGLFAGPVTEADDERLVLPAETVFRIENTRSTALSWPAEIREQFQAELAEQLSSLDEVPLTRLSWVTMAKLAPTS